MTIEFYQTIDEIADYLTGKGYALPNAYKRRDPQEPGRAIKERWEDKLYRLMNKYFKGQKNRLALHLGDRLAVRVMTAKSAADDLLRDIPENVWRDPEIDAQLLRLFIAAGEDGVDLFSETASIGIEWAQVNTQAASWAREYLSDRLLQLDEYTQARLREAIQGFIEIPGTTIADVVNFLPLDPKRALRVAVTEITEVFAQAEQIAGLETKQQYQDVKVIKTWFTNADDRVCPICATLNNTSVDVDQVCETLAGDKLHPPAHVNCRCWIATRTVIYNADL